MSKQLAMFSAGDDLPLFSGTAQRVQPEQAKPLAPGQARLIADIQLRAGSRWQAYSYNTTNEQAARMYTAKHGYAPDYILRRNGLVLAGPIAQKIGD